MDMVDLAVSLLGILVTVLIFGVVQLQGIKTHLGEIGEQLVALETWRTEHEKHDNERYAEQHRRLNMLESRRGGARL